MSRDNPYLDRQKRAIGDVGRRAEKDTAKRLGATQTPASGSTRAKSDMVSGNVRFEHKSTTASAVRVKLRDLRKIKAEANNSGQVPAFNVVFTDLDGHALPQGRWVMVEEREFKKWLSQRS